MLTNANVDAKVVAVIHGLPHQLAIDILDQYLDDGEHSALDAYNARAAVMAAYQEERIEGALIIMDYFDAPEEMMA